MYKVKIGILLQKNHSEIDNTQGRNWTTYYEEWDNTMDLQDLLDTIAIDTEKELDMAQDSSKACHVVCLGTFPCDSGKYFCGSCECYFDKFDLDVGHNCCPYCGGGNYVEGGPDDLVGTIIDKKCESLCPKCDSDDIEWGIKDFADDYTFLKQPAVCNKCGTRFTEFSDIIYDSTEYIIGEE